MRAVVVMLVVVWMAAELPVATTARTAAAKQADTLRAGAGRAEITPPPGYASGAHGPAGSVVRAQLTRLYARAIYLDHSRSADSKLLLVSLDLYGVAQAFQFEIQAHLKEKRRLDLPLSSIIVAATHTHHGPGNFLSASTYNKYGSLVSGYSSDLRKFLLKQVLAAVLAAVDGAGGPAEITIGRALMPIELLRNRSPETFMLNPGAHALMKDLDELRLPSSASACAAYQWPEEQAGAWHLEGCPRLRAVDRSLSVVEVKSGARSIATLVFAAVHPTVLYAEAPVYSGAYLVGNWSDALTMTRHAAAAFQARCTGVAWEIATANAFSLWSLAKMGHLSELNRIAPALLSDADERGDRYAAMNLGTQVMSLIRLAANQPEAARASLEKAATGWSQIGYHVQHHDMLLAFVPLELYCGRPQAAWDRVNATWSAFRWSLLSQIGDLRTEMLLLRSYSALAMAESTENAEPHVTIALRDAARLRRERASWTAAFAGYLEGCASLLRGNRHEGLSKLTAAVTQFDGITAELHAAATRLRLSTLLDGDAGREMHDRAARWFAGQGVVDPIRLSSAFAPGIAIRRT